MKNRASIVFLWCLASVQCVLAIRQYVEIERRPNNNNDLAGTFVFVFGLTATFIAVIIGLLFGWTFFRGSISKNSQPVVIREINQKNIDATIKFRSL